LALLDLFLAGEEFILGVRKGTPLRKRPLSLNPGVKSVNTPCRRAVLEGVHRVVYRACTGGMYLPRWCIPGIYRRDTYPPWYQVYGHIHHCTHTPREAEEPLLASSSPTNREAEGLFWPPFLPKIRRGKRLFWPPFLPKNRREKRLFWPPFLPKSV